MAGQAQTQVAIEVAGVAVAVDRLLTSADMSVTTDGEITAAELGRDLVVEQRQIGARLGEIGLGLI